MTSQRSLVTRFRAAATPAPAGRRRARFLPLVGLALVTAGIGAEPPALAQNFRAIRGHLVGDIYPVAPFNTLGVVHVRFRHPGQDQVIAGLFELVPQGMYRLALSGRPCAEITSDPDQPFVRTLARIDGADGATYTNTATHENVVARDLRRSMSIVLLDENGRGHGRGLLDTDMVDF